MDTNKIANQVARVASRDLFDEGYKVGIQSAWRLDWGIQEVILAAAVVGEASLHPMVKDLAKRLRMHPDARGADRDTAHMAETVGKDMSRKVHRKGELAELGAMAGVMEDANAHIEAGMAYDLASRLGKG